MFGKNILQLQLKDKFFFLVIALLAITGIYFGACTAISYLSGSVDKHKEKLHETKNEIEEAHDNLKALEEKYGPKLEKACNILEDLCIIVDGGLFGAINRLRLWQAACGVLLFLVALKIIFFLP